MHSARTSLLSLLALSITAGETAAQTLLHQLTGTGSTLHEAVFDLDGDGANDFIYSNYQGVRAVYSGADGSVLIDLTEALSAILGDIDIDAVDDLGISGDGVLDFVAMELREFSPSLLAVSGSDGSLIAEFAFPVPAGEEGEFVTSVGDADGDGVGDLIVGSAGFEGCSFPFGSIAFVSGGGNFNPVFFDTATGLFDYPYDWGVALGDVTGDGLGDFGIRQGCGGNELVYSAAGGNLTSSFGPFGSSIKGTISGIGDLDFDGRDDILLWEPFPNDPLRVVVRSGRDLSTLLVLHAVGNRVAGPGDVNGDGYVDVLATSFGGTTSLYSGQDGHMLWTTPRGAARSVRAVGDINGDGRPDMGLEFNNAIQIWSAVSEGHGMPGTAQGPQALLSH